MYFREKRKISCAGTTFSRAVFSFLRIFPKVNPISAYRPEVKVYLDTTI
jgi:hypothetical protein